MKKTRWNMHHERQPKSRDLPEAGKTNCENCTIPEGHVAVPKDLLVDGVFDGKFKRANQRALAEILGITIKQDQKK